MHELAANVARFGPNRGRWPMTAFGRLRSFNVSAGNLNVRFYESGRRSNRTCL